MQNSSQLPNSISTPKSSAFVPIIPIPQIAQPLSSTCQSQLFPSKLKDTYQTYLDLFRKNKLLQVQLNRVHQQKNQLQKKFINIQSDKSQQQNKKKRHRRTANEINRDFLCPLENCDKSYGADAALMQHIKLKHPQFYSSVDYEKLVTNIHSKKNKQNQNIQK